MKFFYKFKRASIGSINIFFALLLFSTTVAFSQSGGSEINLDTVKAGKFDTGKMWTFEFPPSDYFENTYSFTPNEEWYEHIRMSALRFANYCSASFVSEDGLIMTNHHCARQSVTDVSKEDENLHETGFTAWSLDEERQVPGLYVDQLVEIKDVTVEIHGALEQADTDAEKLEIEINKIEEIEEKYTADDGTYGMVTALYSGGKYSLYKYRRYEDVRLVFAPESQAGYFGGDYDNFTYPRYNLDCSFFRVYDDDGNPLKTEHYLNWSKDGIRPGDVVFVVGNPGSTNRLRTVSQLEYTRDISYPRTLVLIEEFIETYENLIKEDPEREFDLNDQLLGFKNSLKAYSGMLDGLRDPVLMQKKKDFEEKFKMAVKSNDELTEKFGNPWRLIDSLRAELRNISNVRFALSTSGITTPQYFVVAEELISIAYELELPEDERSEQFVGYELENYLESLITEDYNSELDKKLLKNKIDLLYTHLGTENEIVKIVTGGNRGYDAVNYMIRSSDLITINSIKELVDKGADAILNSDDPFIYFVFNTDKQFEELNAKFDKMLTEEEGHNQTLGRLLFEVYGTSIPPDATFTLRISDGLVTGFPYNGTEAPSFTTFYGLLDRYYSFEGEFPWTVDEKWLNAPPEFDLSTPLNFVSTCDVTGGASGSPVINRNGEIVGVAFDGNIKSLPGDFIYQPEENRSVAVHSDGMLEAIKDLYQVDRLAKELINGKLSD
ncbi:MAG: S46 family peptidase [Ignavibacteria bacterium]|nr:S46 family peptidase [Ignavibacteria bacterium]MBT8382700.1 S46 family peptidase [Ignavibacteria bacterium]MBT8392766.1 S46 family peptidase [Ignavibacteria bacterium]NNJ54327.1 S46 family peptidase [Ignavibacteriaceae bacterium]NNL22039.1 S46 family peptidase [Ignavibacteriaceae bacterium]